MPKPTLVEQAAAYADAEAKRVSTEKPTSFTVGGSYGDNVASLELTIDRKWSNLWGATAYARAWWYDAPVQPNHKKVDGEIGFRIKREFEEK